jgi:hypothetical protein
MANFYNNIRYLPSNCVGRKTRGIGKKRRKKRVGRNLMGWWRKQESGKMKR